MLKQVLLIISFLTWGLSCHSQGLQNLSFGTNSTLEIATWNIEGFPKLGLLTIDSVTQVIRSLDVDLLALQEIGNELAFQRVVDSLDGYEGYRVDDQYSGLAYIYKTSVVNVDTIYEIYTHLDREFPRAPSVMRMSYFGNEMILINNHLKCCGDGVISTSNAWDEEKRRLDASILLKQYIDTNFPNDKVILLGDLNDVLTDPVASNVFQGFLADTSNYMFADYGLAIGSNAQWSFPSWPSHLDHILITNELFPEFQNDSTEVQTIRVDDFLPGGLNQYDQILSDHRPVILKLEADQVVNLAPLMAHSDVLRNSPNPFSSQTRILIPVPGQSATLEIYDLVGQLVQNLQVAANEHSVVWNSESVPKGMYTMRLIVKGKVTAYGRLLHR